jgi:formylglycine-generating enzyme
MRRLPFLLWACLFFLPVICSAKELPKVAVWDLEPREVKPTYARELTSILVSEISKLENYEVYSQDHVRTLAGWTAERMTLGCTDTKCLTALGQMDIAKLISGSIGKIGNRYSVSLNLFDTQNARSEKSVSEFGRSEDELIDLVQVAVRKLLGIEVAPSKAEGKGSEKAAMGVTSSLPGRSFTDPFTGMELVFVKGGCLQMGDIWGDGTSDEKPVHEVCVDDFYLGRYEVTQGQWQTVMGSNPSRFKECGSNCPVEMVSWNDVQEFTSRLSQRTGKGFRLPTEAEWEYAARSGGKGEKWSGASSEGELGQYAWYGGNSGRRTHPVGEKRPNGLGLHDMSGNVAEWCSDWWERNYYQGSPRNNPKGPDKGFHRVLRGGSWDNTPRNVRATSRSGYPPPDRNSNFGFRLGLSAR